MNNRTKVFFEPWSLGDAVIATSAAHRLMDHAPQAKLAVACASRYVPLLTRIFSEISFDPIDLAYTGRGKKSAFDGTSELRTSSLKAEEVLGIRGDFRDFRAAKYRYPGARRRMSGWAAFAIRRTPALDLPFRLGLLPTVNRYDRWADLLRLPRLPRTVRAPTKPLASARVAIHVGAQWGAKRYPYTAKLADSLRGRGHTVTILGGPGDPETAGSKKIRMLEGAELVSFLRDETDFLVANDSAPTHVGAAIGLPVIAIFANNGAAEWAPPGVLVASSVPAAGYRPKYDYLGDDPFAGGRPWPSADEIVAKLVESGWITA